MTGVCMAQIKSTLPLQHLKRCIRDFELILACPLGSGACNNRSSDEDRDRKEKYCSVDLKIYFSFLKTLALEKR